MNSEANSAKVWTWTKLSKKMSSMEKAQYKKPHERIPNASVDWFGKYSLKETKFHVLVRQPRWKKDETQLQRDARPHTELRNYQGALIQELIFSRDAYDWKRTAMPVSRIFLPLTATLVRYDAREGRKLTYKYPPGEVSEKRRRWVNHRQISRQYKPLYEKRNTTLRITSSETSLIGKSVVRTWRTNSV